jgi:eukaryotic-like serine/threonine-protein kinase
MSDASDRWRRVEELCHAALEHDASERSAFLTAACGDDDGLRREADALLAHERSAEGFLGSVIGAVAANILNDRAVSLVGRRIGPFEIVSPLGAGGMGDVYRARDTELGREVAIKVLPPAFLASRDRLARFEREARILAALNHPHIGAIYGLEPFDGGRALILELVEGETLADRLEKGSGSGSAALGVPIAQALHIARQVAEALDAAHEKGIVHRDLKPSNIKITPAGVVKVLDFGLAKGGDASAPDASRSPTMTVGDTAEGKVLGSPAYMSPEQARGLAVDRRTDIWAYGCVLYEALTGQPAFSGATVSDYIAAILDREPDWNALPETTPTMIRRLLRRCIEKDPKRRLRDIGDARIEIDEAIASPVEKMAAASVGLRAADRSVPAWIWAVVCGACVGLGALMMWPVASSRSQSAPLTTRSVVTLPSSAVIPETNAPTVTVSPDGRMLAFAAVAGGRSRIFIRPIDALTATPLPGSEGTASGEDLARAPTFSPDGQWLAFVADGVLKKIAVSGGAPQSLGPVNHLKSLTWTDDGRLVFSALGGTGEMGLVAMSANGGSPQTLTTPDVGANEKTHRAAEMLPGGKALLVTVGMADMSSFDDSRIEAIVVATGQRKVLVRGGMQPRYLPTGHLVYARAGTLLAVRLDVERLEVVGAPTVVVDNVYTDSVYGFADFAVSHNGSLVYVPGGANTHDSSLVWVDRQGRSEVAADVRRNFVQVRISPEGQRIALTIDASNDDLWVYDLQRTTLSRLVHGWDNASPVWSVDGGRITYSSGRPRKPGESGIYSQTVDGPDDPTPLSGAVDFGYPNGWSAGDRHLLVTTQNGTDLLFWSADDRKMHPLVQTAAAEADARLSPDGRWVAYESDRAGRNEVHVRRFPGPSRDWLVSLSGGAYPVWSGDGRQLFFRDGARMMVVDIAHSAEFSSGRPKLLFEAPDMNVAVDAYDVARDGRLLMIRHEPRVATQLNLVQNWTEELKQRVPTR